MHLDVEQIERVRHGELDAGPAAEARAHLRACPHCARRVAEAQREEEELFAALRLLDHPVPSVDVGEIVRRGAAHRPRAARVAAGVALALAASGALWAAPGSPLPGLVGAAAELVSSDRPTPTATEPSEPATVPAPPEPVHTSGVSVDPGARLAVAFASTQARGSVEVRLVDAPEVSVRALGEAVPFDVDVDRVAVGNAGATADYEILVPRSAPSVTVRVGDATVLRAARGRIVAGPTPDASGVVRIPLDGKPG